MPYLELEGAKPTDQPFELSGETIVGSGSQAGWRLHNRDLAARHFRIRLSSDGSRNVAPCSPQNVIIVGGDQVPPAGVPLASGDAIAAGSARFIFVEDLSDPRPRPPAEPEPAYLVDLKERAGYSLSRRVVQIGREIGCSVVLREPTVSRFHADVRSEGGEYAVYSMGASGTLVNGEPVTSPRVLRPDDQIRIGSTTLTFVRGPLSSGVTEATFEARDEGALHRRPTLTGGRAIAGPRAAVGNPKVLVGIAAAVAAGATLLVLVL